MPNLPTSGPRSQDTDEAVSLANDSRYGLAGAVWTKDIHRGHRVAHALRTGTVWVELTGGTRDPFTLG